MILIYKENKEWLVEKRPFEGTKVTQKLLNKKIEERNIVGSFSSMIHAKHFSRSRFYSSRIYLFKRNVWVKIHVDHEVKKGSDEFMLAENPVVKKHMSYFQIRRNMYRGFVVPGFVKTLRYSLIMTFLSLGISIFAFIINSGIGMTANEYATIVTSNRFEFLIPAFLLLIWPIWTIVEYIIRLLLVKKLENFTKYKDFTHASVVKTFRRLEFAQLFVVSFVVSVSAIWVAIIALDDPNDFIDFDSVIGPFILLKMIFIIIPKIFLFVITIRAIKRIRVWRTNEDFITAVATLTVMDNNGEAYAKAALETVSVYNDHNFDKALKKHYKYSDRVTLIESLISHKSYYLKDSDVKKIDKMTNEYMNDIKIESEIYEELHPGGAE